MPSVDAFHLSRSPWTVQVNFPSFASEHPLPPKFPSGPRSHPSFLSAGQGGPSAFDGLAAEALVVAVECSFLSQPNKDTDARESKAALDKNDLINAVRIMFASEPDVDSPHYAALPVGENLASLVKHSDHGQAGGIPVHIPASQQTPFSQLGTPLQLTLHEVPEQLTAPLHEVIPVQSIVVSVAVLATPAAHARVPAQLTAHVFPLHEIRC